MGIRFSNGFRIGAGTPPQSLNFFTDLSNITSYFRNYVMDFRNPDFHEYDLDGDGFYISDGGGDMYDGGNVTTPWLLSNATYTGTTGYDSNDYPYAIDYTKVGNTETIDTSFGYQSLGYAGSTYLPLTVIGTRATIASPGDPIGFQVGGNIGADGSGTHIEGNIYSGDNVSGFTVHSFYSETYDAGDPSVCDVFILLGHPSWNSVFGNVYYGADQGTQGSSAFLYTSGNGAQNILAIKTLLSKSSGQEVTFSEINAVVDNFIMRIGETIITPSPTPTPSITPTMTPSPLPLSQFTPNGTTGSNGLLTYLNYTNGVDSGNNVLLPDSSGFNHPYAWSGNNPYSSGTTGYTFDTNTWAYASDASSYNLGFNSLTIEMWVKLPTIPSTMTLLGAGGNNSGGWALRIDSDGNQLNLVKYNIADQNVNLPYTLQADTWYHIVAAQGGTSLTFFINGVIVGAVNTGTSNNFSFPNGTVNISRDYYTNGNYAMSLGILKVYDYCLLAADVLTEFDDTKTGYGYAGVSPTPTPSETPSSTPNATSTPTPTPSATVSTTGATFTSYPLNLQCSPGGMTSGVTFMFDTTTPTVNVTNDPDSILPNGALAFAAIDSNGIDRSSFFDSITGNTTFSLSQGSNVATFSTTTGGFVKLNQGGIDFYPTADLTKITQLTTSNGTFTCGQDIEIGLLVSGGTPGGGGATGYQFYSDEGNINAMPPISNGNIIFVYNGSPMVETFNPDYTSGSLNLYFNRYGADGTDNLTAITALDNNGGLINMSQNGNNATYSGTSTNYSYFSGDNYLQLTVTNSGQQTGFAGTPFVSGSTINVTFNA